MPKASNDTRATNNAPRAFNYTDYRTFLTEYILAKKKSKSTFSFRYVAHRLGVNPGFFNKVIKGTRNLSPENTLRLMDILKLPRRERRYFELLVQYNQAKKQLEKEHFFELLKSFSNSKIRQISHEHYPMYENWYNMVLREMLHAVPCYDTSDATCKRLANYMSPSVKPAQIRKSLNTLLELGVIRGQGPSGRLCLNDNLITTGPDIPQVVVRKLLGQFFDLGRESLERFEKNERVCASVTVSVSEKGYESIRSRLEQCRKEVLDIVDQDKLKLNRIYHMNMQLFPVSKQLQGVPS